MDRLQFTSVLDRYNSLELNEAEEVSRLRSQAPYCQIFPVIAARYARDHKLNTQAQLLQMAAVWATDRAVLKDLMLANQFGSDDGAVIEAIRRVDLADEIIKDLKRLKHLKLQFEKLYDKMPAPETTAMPASSTPKSRKSTRRKPARHVDDALISEIKSRKKIEPSNERQKAQIEVIDEFIKKKPAIKPTRSAPSDHHEVEVEKSTDFNDGVVSETLVEILIKQDKKEKAIDVLKKLIWKFPQKKAYFAAKIEELKK